MKRLLLSVFVLALAAGPATAASLTVLHPNGGEELLVGMATAIKWQAVGVSDKVKLLLVRGGGAIVGVIASDLDPASPSYVWSAGHYQGGIAAPGSNYKIRVKAGSLEDESDKVFTLFEGSPPSQSGQVMQLTSPNGGEKWPLGTKKDVTWQSVGVSGKVKLEILSHPALAVLGLVADDMPATGSMIWEWGRHAAGYVPSGKQYVLRVTSKSTPALSDSSDGPFTVDPFVLNKAVQVSRKPIVGNLALAAAIAVTSPQAGGAYVAGEPLPIAWNKDIGVAGYITMALLDDQGTELESRGNIANTGAYDGWIPDAKYTWPGTKYRIRLTIKNPSNQQHASGLSGLFSIKAPPPLEKVTRTLARNGETETTHTRQYQDEGMPECLSASRPAPGREPGAREIKVGQHVVSGRQGECDWYEAYYFKGHVRFDLDEIAGKEIVEAKLLVSLSGFQQLNPQGDLATNQECDSNCDVYIEGPGYTGGILASFSIFGIGEKKSIDVTKAVRHWAAGNANEGLLFRSKLDHSDFANSVCLKYYATMFLTVKYVDYK